MESASRHQTKLEAQIPDSLQGVPRVCNREECGSSNIELKYFDNKEKVGYNQPRFFCKSCQRTFTLGGKVRGEYKKANRKTKKVKTNTMAVNIQAQGVEPNKHNQSQQLDLERNRLSRSLNTEALSLGMNSNGVCNTGEAASSKNIQADLEEKTQETNSVEGNAVPFQIDDCEDANCNSEEANCNLKGDKTEEDQTEDDFHNIGEALHLQKDLLKHNAQLHLLNAQVTIHDFQVKKEAMNIDMSCKVLPRESQNLGFKSKKKQDKIDEGIVGLRKFAEEAAGGLVSPSKYHEMVANKAQTEVMSQVITSMHLKVQEMDVKHVPHSIMVAIEEEAKQFKDRVMELVD